MGGWEPGSGAAFSAVVVNGGAEYFVMGPFPGGAMLRKVVIQGMLQSDMSAGDVRVGVTVGGGATASLESFEAGASVISRSETRLGRMPVLRWVWGAQAVLWMELYPGVVLGSGSQYVIVAIDNQSIGAVVYMQGALDVWRRRGGEGVAAVGVGAG